MTIAKRHIIAAIELVGNEEGASVVYTPPSKKYEIRAIRRKRGVDLKWGVVGTFYQPKGGKRG